MPAVTRLARFLRRLLTDGKLAESSFLVCQTPKKMCFNVKISVVPEGA
jgi:hypothetical protein